MPQPSRRDPAGCFAFSASRDVYSCEPATAEAVKPVTVGKHPCPECGGNLEWNPARQALACPYCGTVVPWSPAQAAEPVPRSSSRTWRPRCAIRPAARGWGDGRREVQCQSCQAISVFVDGARGAALRFLRLALHHRA